MLGAGPTDCWSMERLLWSADRLLGSAGFSTSRYTVGTAFYGVAATGVVPSWLASAHRRTGTINVTIGVYATGAWDALRNCLGGQKTQEEEC